MGRTPYAATSRKVLPAQRLHAEAFYGKCRSRAAPCELLATGRLVDPPDRSTAASRLLDNRHPMGGEILSPDPPASLTGKRLPFRRRWRAARRVSPRSRRW